jgi:hypothetical protein
LQLSQRRFSPTFGEKWEGPVKQEA